MTDGTAKWRMRDIRVRHATGEIFPWVYGNPPECEKALLCDGSTFDGDTYYELAQLIGGTTLPNLTDGRFLEGSTTAGTKKNAGLPNITGRLWQLGQWGLDENSRDEHSDLGAFYSKKDDNIPCALFSKEKAGVISFSAQLSNPIYGASDTVQPKSFTVKYYICGA